MDKLLIYYNVYIVKGTKCIDYFASVFGYHYNFLTLVRHGKKKVNPKRLFKNCSKIRIGSKTLSWNGRKEYYGVPPLESGTFWIWKNRLADKLAKETIDEKELEKKLMK